MGDVAAPNIGKAVMQGLVDKAGGASAAAARLGISASLLQRFLDGTMEVPDAMLLKAVDQVLAESPAPPARPPAT